jgi:sulfur-oxidizing protein SoxY
MNHFQLRRKTLRAAGACFAWAAGLGTGLLRAGDALAAAWNKAGFSAQAVPEALKSLGATALTDSKDIVITAPDIAENGAVVPVAVTSKIPNTQSISIIAEKNPFPLAATFDIEPGLEPYVSTRLKMGQTANVRAVVKADGRFYTVVREVKITIGGCGG